jgi:hypothetical protein
VFHLYVDGAYVRTGCSLRQLVRALGRPRRTHAEIINHVGARVATWDPESRSWF